MLAIIILFFTIKVFRASVETFLIFFALFSSCFLVAESGSENAGAVLHEEFHHGQVIARSSAVQWRPEIKKKQKQKNKPSIKIYDGVRAF